MNPVGSRDRAFRRDTGRSIQIVENDINKHFVVFRSRSASNGMKKLIVGVGVLAVAALMPLVTFAAYFNAGKTVDIGASQAVDQNAYVAGGTVTVSAPVAGDLLAAGGTVFVSSKVEGDIEAAAGTLIMTGITAQDVRVAGGNVTVGGAIAGELAAAGGQLSVAPSTTIAKDSYLRGAAVAFSGDEAGNLDVAGSQVVIAGTVEKDLTITAAKSVTIAKGAIVKGNLDYTSPVAATVEPGAEIAGTTTFHQAAAPAKAEHQGWLGPFAALFTFLALMKFLTGLAVAYLLWYVFRKDAVAMLHEATSRFWPSLLRGFVFLVAVPVAVIVAFVTIVGGMVGVIAALAYAALLLLGVPASVMFASSLLMKCRTDLRWYHLLFGAVVLALVALIPFIGWLACFIVWLAAFGATLAVLGRRFAR